MTFALVRMLGVGGYGEVWLVQDESGKEFALKKLHEYSAEAFRCLRQEARKLFALRGVSGVVRLITWKLEGADPFIVMELAEGSLQKVADAGPMNSWAAAAIIREVARAVAASHSCGVIHLDLKPANILVQAGRYKLADFGLGKGMDSICLTMGGRGTPGYMAPEQYAGAKTSACDVYGLGATFYHLITGKFPPEHPALDPRRAKPRCPAPIATLVLRMTAARPDDRPSLPEVQEVLGTLLAKHAAGQKAREEMITGLVTAGLAVGGGIALIALIAAILRAK